MDYQEPEDRHDHPVYDHGETMPFEKQLAKLAHGSYAKAHGSDADQYTRGTSYRVHPNALYSDDQITTYQSIYDPFDIVIAHRGTHLTAKDRMKDLKADLAFAFGRGGVDKRFRDRRKKTEYIIQDSGAKNIHLTGHSLGGGTVNHAIANSDIVRNAITSAHTYNAAANPYFKNSQKLNKVQKAQLDNIVTHHRIDGDPVSEGFTANLPFGQLKTYDDVAKKTWFDTVLSATNPFIGFAKRTKNTHGINNFYVS